MTSTATEIQEAAAAELTINLTALWDAMKEIATDPSKALIDGNGQLIIKDAAVAAKIAGYFPLAAPIAAPIANDLELAAALEPIVGGGVVTLIGLAKTFKIKLPPINFGSLDDNAGEQQAKDVHSSIGIGRP